MQNEYSMRKYLALYYLHTDNIKLRKSPNCIKKGELRNTKLDRDRYLKKSR